MTKRLNKYAKLYEAIAGRVQFDKPHFFSLKWMRKMGSLK